MDMSKKTKKLITSVLLGATLFGGVGSANAGGLFHEILDGIKDEMKESIKDSTVGSLKRGNEAREHRNQVNMQSGKLNYSLDSAAATRDYQLSNNTICTSTSKNNASFGSNRNTRTNGNTNQNCSDKAYTGNLEAEMKAASKLRIQQANFAEKRRQRLQNEADRDARTLRKKELTTAKHAARAAVRAEKDRARQFRSNAQDMRSNSKPQSSYYYKTPQQKTYSQPTQVAKSKPKLTGAARYQ